MSACANSCVLNEYRSTESIVFYMLSFEDFVKACNLRTLIDISFVHTVIQVIAFRFEYFKI